MSYYEDQVVESCHPRPDHSLSHLSGVKLGQKLSRMMTRFSALRSPARDYLNYIT